MPVEAKRIGCEAQFTNSPMLYGAHADGVAVGSEGRIEWWAGNLGNAPVINLDYRTYHALGWTIAANINGTTFTNDSTGHGMFVSIDNVFGF